MFSKERAKRGLIEYQLKVTGEAMRITMYNTFFFFFFGFYIFLFSNKCSEWKCTLSKSLVTACIFQERAFSVTVLLIGEKPCDHTALTIFLVLTSEIIIWKKRKKANQTIKITYFSILALNGFHLQLLLWTKHPLKHRPVVGRVISTSTQLYKWLLHLFCMWQDFSTRPSCLACTLNQCV